MTLTQATAWLTELEARAEAVMGDPGWVVATDDNGLKIELLNGSHPRGDHVRGSVVLGTSLETAADRLLLDQDAHVAWDDTLDRWVSHGELEADGVVHRVLQIPVFTGAHPIIQNRELLYHEAIVKTPSSVTTLGASRDLPGIAVLQGCRRAWLGLSVRTVALVKPGQVRYSALWQTDLGGWLPRRAVTRGQVKAMRAEHQKFRGWWPVAD